MKCITVGIIDDHNLFVRSLAQLLNNSEGIHVAITAENGQEYIRKLEKSKLPDITLMDIDMPILDGPETTKCLIDKCEGCKIIALSGHKEKKYITEMVLSGVSGFLFKNVKPEELLKAITVVFNGGVYFNNESVGVLRNIYVKKDGIDIGNIKLTPAETNVIELICKECTNAEIGESLGISKSTVEGHKRKIIAKMGVKNSIGIGIFAITNSIVKK